MKKTLSAAAAVSVLLAFTGCAKEKQETTNEAAKRHFEAWMHVNHPDAEKAGLGIYIIKDGAGTGEAEGIEGAAAGLDFGDAPYIYVTYTVTDLEGNVTSTNDIKVSRQIGKYDPSYYYGPAVWVNSTSSIPIGVREMLKGMKTRQKRTAVIPSWLMGYKEYGTEAEYIGNETEGSDCIYTVEVADTASDIYRKQIEKIEKLEYEYTDSLGNRKIWKVSAKDTVYNGFYYLKIKSGEPVKGEDGKKSLKAMEDGTGIKINYTGRLLNGQAFDTTDEKVAKDNNIYKPLKTYAATSATWSADSTAVKIGGNDVVQGFSSTLVRMKYYGAEGIGVSFSPLGYKDTGSGSLIPGYAPLIFEIKIEEED